MIDGRLAWGLLSTSRINLAVIPPIKASARSLLAGVASRDKNKALAYAEERDIPRAYATYEEMLADPDIDIVYNSLPNSLHAEWSIKALAAGKHVLCEKPLTTSLADMDALASAAKKSGKILAEALMYRHHPQTKRVKELVATGTIGEPRTMRGSFTFKMGSEDDHRLLAAMGGGSIWDVGCYPISYGRLIAGTDPVEVWGRAEFGQGGADETFTGELLFPGGLVLQFDCGFRSPYRTRFEVSGGLGTIAVASPFKPSAGDAVVVALEGRSETIAFAASDLYAYEIADMENCVLDGRPQGVSLADSRGNILAILALLRSARSGRAERLG